MNAYTKPEMPDVAATQTAQQNGTLDWVGMSKIALPVVVKDNQHGNYDAKAFVESYVNLVSPDVKGIHMSRLYLLLADFSRNGVLTIASLASFLKEKLASHDDISNSTCMQLEFDYFINQPALKSEYSGWKDYPVTIKGVLKGDKVETEISVKIPYSSTCPCSAALARQILQQAFSDDFADKSAIDKETIEKWLQSERGSVATPHSQRSYADVVVKLDDSYEDGFPISDLIQVIESTLKTAVQTAVKREDEQEFARLNGSNQMFCEDAARRVKNILNLQPNFVDFWVRIEHIESLHAHDAVAMCTKGVANGYLPILHR
ncbi:MAG: GTP cyclohydrolase I [Cellvibrionaceae bacterium]|jgi:GTP cyclohydrolase I